MSDGTEGSPTWEPRWDDAPDAYERCPRCGGKNIRMSGGSYNAKKDGKSLIVDGHAVMHESRNYFCPNCKLFEMSTSEQPEKYWALRERWRDTRYVVEKGSIARILDAQIAARDKEEREDVWPHEPHAFRTTEDRDISHARRVAAKLKQYPENQELLAEVIAHPDSDEPRRAYAAWMARQDPLMFDDIYTAGPVKDRPKMPGDDPKEIARFIENQLRVADSYRRDPKANPDLLMADQPYPNTVEHMRGGGPSFYGRDDIDVMGDVLQPGGFSRGFVSAVTMQSKYFLMFTEEVFRRAPIQHLELTYAGQHMAQLAATEDLWRVRSLRLPERNDLNKHMRLNKLRDEHLRILASSPHLAGLALLDLEDAAITPRALDYLALSPYLTSLSDVRVDHYYYEDFKGRFGIDTGKEFEASKIPDWAPELEARHGYLPWLHPEEHYGVRTPRTELVAMHPVGNRAFRPDIAARTRPRLPVKLVEAVTSRITSAGAIKERAVMLPLEGGRLVATLEKVGPHPDLAGIAVLATIAIQQTPPGIEVYDAAMKRTTVLAARETVTLVVPTFLEPMG